MLYRPLAAAFALAACIHAQTGTKGGSDNPDARPPVTKADLEIVKRARQIIDSPARWNRADNRICPKDAKTFSLYCAIEKATDEVSGNFEHRGAAMQEARFVIEEVAPKKDYAHRLMGYNNDPTTTFADLQRVFDLLEDRVAKRLKGEPPVPRKVAVVETPPAAAQPDVPVTKADLEVVHRVREILNSESRWNRADRQDCPADAKTFSLFCAFRMAATQVPGASQNAIDEARQAITDTASADKHYTARLTDYNNDPTVTFADLQRFLTLVEERLAKRMGH
ncbi:MAG TPA: hypothetical protein VKU19_15490 [Bryobacteraceae bacterium]|nr:hypothetical protein [Bryobacteraceae bacterium]